MMSVFTRTMLATIAIIGMAIAAPVAVAQVQGGYPSFVGTLIANDCIKAANNYQARDAGAPCGAGTVPTGTANDLAYWAVTGNALSPLATANNGVLITSSGGVPSISSTLPSGLSAANLALTTPFLGTPQSGTLTNATGLPISSGVAGLGTGVATALGNVVNVSGGLAPVTSPVLITPSIGAAIGTSLALGGCTISGLDFCTANGAAIGGALTLEDGSVWNGSGLTMPGTTQTFMGTGASITWLYENLQAASNSNVSTFDFRFLSSTTNRVFVRETFGSPTSTDASRAGSWSIGTAVNGSGANPEISLVGNQLTLSAFTNTPALMSAGTKFTISGCSATTTIGGAAAGKFTSGTTGTCAPTITINGAAGYTANNGWSCWANDETTPADKITVQSSTTTTVTLTGTTVSGDVIDFGCMAF